MIQVRLFGRFSELLDEGDLFVVGPEGIATVEDVYRHLQSARPELHREVTGPQVLVAVNQEIVSAGHPVADGDEVAFLPPVTGG